MINCNNNYNTDDRANTPETVGIVDVSLISNLKKEMSSTQIICQQFYVHDCQHYQCLKNLFKQISQFKTVHFNTSYEAKMGYSFFGVVPTMFESRVRWRDEGRRTRAEKMRQEETLSLTSLKHINMRHKQFKQS